MTDYRVIWEIDIEADSPAEAAIEARRRVVAADTIATVFDVAVRIAECGGIDDGPVFQRIAQFDVRSSPSHPHYRAVPTDAESLVDLADAARPETDEDWGSERQIAAQNAFFEAVQKRLPAETFAYLESYCLKATVDEMIDEALRLVAEEEGELACPVNDPDCLGGEGDCHDACIPPEATP